MESGIKFEADQGVLAILESQEIESGLHVS